MIAGFFAPTIWLSQRLSFSRKYLLIGGVALAALAALSTPLLRQAAADRQLAQLERTGLQHYLAQADALAGLVALRSQAVAANTAAPRLPPQLDQDIGRLVQQARLAQLPAAAERLERSWEQARGLAPEDGPQGRFAKLTGTINATLGLIQDSARRHRLNVDPELDAAFDMLSTRLPLVLETLAKQQDALALDSAEMSLYAVGAQVVMSESAASLRGGIAQLLAAGPAAPALQPALQRFLAQLSRQQEAADRALSERSGMAELRTLSQGNLVLAHALLRDAAGVADAHLLARMDRLAQLQWTVAILLLATVGAIAYLFAGMYLSTLGSLKRLSDGSAAFCNGRLDARIQLDTRDELVLVARNFNSVADEFGRLLDLIHAQNEARAAERELMEMALIEVSESQQKSIGQELHDDLGQHLTSIAFFGAAVTQRLKAGGQPEAEAAQRIVDLVNQSIDKTRRISKGLYPAALESQGLPAALLELVDNVRHMTGIVCELRVDPAVRVDDPAHAINLYRIVQEAVNNAIKHGKAGRIDITLERRGGLHCLSVRDDGIGFDPERLGRSQGLGMSSLRLRAQRLGGDAALVRNTEGGTTVVINYPADDGKGQQHEH